MLYFTVYAVHVGIHDGGLECYPLKCVPTLFTLQYYDVPNIISVTHSQIDI